MKPKIAVLIPCLNEELTIDQVVKDFREQLPEAEIHVFDNASTDATRTVAEEAGATVHTEPRRGKGNVVQTMFREVRADIYVMVDGDNTYPPEQVHGLIEEVASGRADMAVGSRLMAADSSFRTLNRLGNRFFLGLINSLFGARLTDVLSGYRAMSRRFVTGVPVLVSGFEVEVEMTIKALERGFRLSEKPARLRDRPRGSHSKLRKFRDGWRILATILALLRDYRPLPTFAGPGLLAVALGLILGVGSGLPALVALGGVFAILAGVVLHTANRRLREVESLTRLQAAPRGRSRKHRAEPQRGRRLPAP
jgi:glycosyltransferase involved in cell wall biosynthesis